MKKMIHLPLILLTACGTQSISQPDQFLTTTSVSNKSDTVQSNTLIQQNDSGCRSYLELNKDSGIFYNDYINFNPDVSTTVVPIAARFSDCSFKVEDVRYQRLYFYQGSQAVNISTDVNEFQNSKPWPWSKEPDGKKALRYIVEAEISFCGLYKATNQTSIQLFTETELKDGQIIRGKTFVLEISSEKAEYCNHPPKINQHPSPTNL